MSKRKDNPVKVLVDDNSPLMNKTDDEISKIYNDNIKAIYKEIGDDDIEEKYVEQVVNTNLNVAELKSNNCITAKKIIPSVIVGLSTGLAMTPVFNHLIKQSEIFGNDIHKNDYTFAISTINTSCIYGVTATGSMYYFLKSKELNVRNNLDRKLLILAKIAASCVALVPLSLLWVIEIENQKAVKSEGFDAFIAWATFTTAPLLISKCIDSCRSINKMYQNIETIQLDSTGSKFFVYTPVALSLVGRFISYYAAGNNLAKAAGGDNTTSMIAGVASGGIGSLSTSIFEFTALKSLFKKQTESFTLTKFCAAAASIIEGTWFTIPVVSIGITATEGWNPFVKALLFTPLFVSSAAAESLNIYEVGENIYDSLTGCCRPTDPEDQ